MRFGLTRVDQPVAEIVPNTQEFGTGANSSLVARNWEVVERVGFVRKIGGVREAYFRLATALRGSLEVFDLAHPAGQWVPSGENLGHHLQVVDFKRLKSPTHSIDRTGCSLRVQDRSRRRPVNPSTTK